MGQQLKNKTAKQSIHSQLLLDFLGEITVLRGGHVSHLPNDNNNISHSHSEIWRVNSFNPLDFCLLTFFTILPLLPVKLKPLLIHEKYQALLPHCHDCISPRSACKPPSDFVTLLTTLTLFYVVFSCVTLGQGAQSCLTQVKSAEQDFETGLVPF